MVINAILINNNFPLPQYKKKKLSRISCENKLKIAYGHVVVSGFCKLFQLVSQVFMPVNKLK